MKCQTCKKDSSALNQCSMCKTVYYCSRLCQKKDWTRHKQQCGPYIEKKRKQARDQLATSAPARERPKVSVSVRRKTVASETATISASKYDTGSSTNSIQDVEEETPKSKYAKSKLVASDVPTAFCQYKYISSCDNIDSNLLILLPGVGDDFEQYVLLAENLKIPQCCYLVLQGIFELPFSSGWCWYPVFDNNAEFITPTSNDRTRLSGLKKSRRSLFKLLEILISKYSWKTPNIFFLGFSQGATVAIDVALHSRSLDQRAFGGVVVISDSIFEEALIRGFVEPYPERTKFPSTLPPLFLSHGIRDQRNSLQKAKEKHQLIVSVYSSTNARNDSVEWNTFDKGHQMISTKQEAEAILRFLSKHMVIRSVAIESVPGVIALN